MKLGVDIKCVAVYNKRVAKKRKEMINCRQHMADRPQKTRKEMIQEYG